MEKKKRGKIRREDGKTEREKKKKLGKQFDAERNT